VKTRKPRNRKPRTKVEVIPWPKNQTSAGKARVRAAKARQRPKRKRRNPSGASGVGSTKTGQRTRKSCVVVEDEYIAAIVVANQPAFNVVSYPINPGQAITFPWLAKEAAQWEKYTFEMLEFYVKREVSEFAPAGQQGKVILSVDFDASDAPPATKQQMEDTDPHVDAMPCENQRLRLNRRDLHGPMTLAKYVRLGGLPGSSDIKTYDVGNLNVATQGIPSNTEVGELRVRYRCRFEIPVLESVTTAPANHSVSLYAQVPGVEQTYGGGERSILQMPTVVNGLGLTNSAGVITMVDSGNFNVDFSGTVGMTTSGLSQDVQVQLLVNTIPVAQYYSSIDYNLVDADWNVASGSLTWFLQAKKGDVIGIQIYFPNLAGYASGQLRVTAM